MNAIFYAGAFLLVIGVLIFVHECGHYLVARWCGVKVLRFSLGFGPSVWSTRVGADLTEWSLAVMPLGGYVKMLDEREAPVPESERHRAFNTQSLARRCLIVAAGPIFNLLLAVLLYWVTACMGTEDLVPRLGRIVEGTPAAVAGLREGDLIEQIDGRAIKGWADLRWSVMRGALQPGNVEVVVRRDDGSRAELPLMLSGVKVDEQASDPMLQVGINLRPTLPAVLGKPIAAGPAERAGLQAGDRVLSVGGVPVRFWHEMTEIISASPGRPLQFVVERDAVRVSVVVTTEAVGSAPQRGLIRVPQAEDSEFFRARRALVRYGVLEGASFALTHTADMAVFQLRAIWHMATGRMSWRNVSGPVSIADAAGQSAKAGLEPYLALAAALSVSLGVLNLLPIPILDGGHILYYVIERIRGRALSEAAEAVFQRVGLVILILLMSLAFFNDLNRVLFG